VGKIICGDNTAKPEVSNLIKPEGKIRTKRRAMYVYRNIEALRATIVAVEKQ